jgi:hypothetical protein
MHRIDALLLPRLPAGDGVATKAAPVGARDALMTLAPSSLWMVRHARGDGLESLASLVQKLPAYRLELGRDVQSIAYCIRSLVQNGAVPSTDITQQSEAYV